MELGNQPQNKQTVGYEYVKEELMLGSFILHAHVNKDINEYISCLCDQDCKYVLMNDLKKLHVEQKGQEDEAQLFQESKNNGHSEALIKPILRQKVTFFQYLTEIYSIYMHLEVDQTISAELLFMTSFSDESQKYQFQDGFQGFRAAVIYQQCGRYYKFSVFVFKSYPKAIIQTEIYVRRSDIAKEAFENQEQVGFNHLVVSENEWIVIFTWLLTNKNNLNSNFDPQYDNLIKVIRSNSEILQKKINEIRKRSFTLLYDLSIFYKGFE